jgi:hypothetical protein
MGRRDKTFIKKACKKYNANDRNSERNADL